LKINTEWFINEAKNIVNDIKMDFECPNCELYIWEYSFKELRKSWQFYCNNCDILINYSFENGK